MNMQKIPDEDLKAINVSFSKSKKDKVQISARGKKIGAKTGVVDVNGFYIKSYVGRILKHDKKYLFFAPLSLVLINCFNLLMRCNANQF